MNNDKASLFLCLPFSCFLPSCIRPSYIRPSYILPAYILPSYLTRLSVISILCCCLTIPLLAQASDNDPCNPKDFSTVEKVGNYVSADCFLDSSLVDADDLQKDAQTFWRERKGFFSLFPEQSSLARALHERASLALADLQVLASTGKVCDVAAYKQVIWRFGRDKVIPDITSTDRSSEYCAEIPGEQISSFALEKILFDCDLANLSNSDCRQKVSNTKLLLDEYSLARKRAMMTSRDLITQISDRVDAKNAAWEIFLFESKPMYPWDIAFTDAVFGRYDETYKDGFHPPVQTQLFVAHPSIGYEWVDQAAKGDRLAPTLYLEVIGANRWNPSNRFIDAWGLRRISGFSLLASVTDRADVDSVRPGLLLTIDNSYEVGLNISEGDIGLMLGYNLMNLWKSKYKQDVESWRDRLNSFDGDL